MAIPVPITADVGSASTDSWALLSASRPGVRARLAQQNTTSTCRSSGYLWRTTDTLLSQIQDGTVVPAWSKDSWIDHPAGSAALWLHLSASQVDDSYFDDKVIESDTRADSTSVAHYVFGDGSDDYPTVDLGNENDGKVFQFYCKAIDSLPTADNAHLKFHSHPYESDVHDSDTTPTGTDDVVLVRNNPSLTGSLFSAEFSSQLTVDKWCLVTLFKEDFTKAGGALWSRISAGKFQMVHVGGNTSEKARFSSLYFGDPADAPMKSVTHISRKVVDDTPLVLSLDAPPSTDADVKGIVVVR